MEISWRFKNYTLPYYRSVLQKAIFREDGPHLILDAGCGQYGSIEAPLQANYKVIGVDVNKRLLAKAKSQGVMIEDYIAASLTCLPFKSNIFDIALSQDVLEHVEEKAKSVQEISRVIRRGGTLLGSTTNLLNPLMLFDTLAPKCITQSLIQHYSEQEYFQRHTRLTPIKLRYFLKACFQENRLSFIGAPPFSSPKYHKKENLPWFVRTWILFDRLTSQQFLETFKEMILFEAVK